ncbi:MAG: DUF5677 domain-containing protein [Burkholderiales bacterium]
MAADSILDEGFLSPHINSYVAEHVEENREICEIAEALNRVGQGILAQAELTVIAQEVADPKPIALLLLIRTMSGFQAVILLSERGMIVEARTLAGSCYENVYVLSALKKDGEALVKAMVADEMHARKTGSR